MLLRVRLLTIYKLRQQNYSLIRETYREVLALEISQRFILLSINVAQLCC